jgi:hypothetical protein
MTSSIGKARFVRDQIIQDEISAADRLPVRLRIPRAMQQHHHRISGRKAGVVSRWRVDEEVARLPARSPGAIPVFLHDAVWHVADIMHSRRIARNRHQALRGAVSCQLHRDILGVGNDQAIHGERVRQNFARQRTHRDRPHTRIVACHRNRGRYVDAARCYPFAAQRYFFRGGRT